MVFDFIKKRSGEKEEYNKEKIERSLAKAITASGIQDNPLVDKFSEDVEKYLLASSNTNNFNTDDIRSAINIVLLENNLPEASKIYFQKRGKKIKGIGEQKISVRKIKKRDGTIIDFNEKKNIRSNLKGWPIYTRI